MCSRRSRASSSCASAARTSSGTSSYSASWRPTGSTPSARAPCRRPCRTSKSRGAPPARKRATARRSAAPDRLVLEVEFFGAELLGGEPSLARLSRLCAAAATAVEVTDAHVAIEFVDERRIAQLNTSHRGRAQPTDVLSFPIDGVEPLGVPGAGRALDGDAPPLPPRELGDLVICPAQTSDVSEAVI